MCNRSPAYQELTTIVRTGCMGALRTLDKMKVSLEAPKLGVVIMLKQDSNHPHVTPTLAKYSAHLI